MYCLGLTGIPFVCRYWIERPVNLRRRTTYGFVQEGNVKSLMKARMNGKLPSRLLSRIQQHSKFKKLAWLGWACWLTVDGRKSHEIQLIWYCYLIWPLIWYDLFNWFDYDITSISVSLSIVEQRRKLHCVYRLWCHMTWTANFLRLSRSSQCPTQLNSSLRECPKVIHAWAPLEAARATKVMPVVVAALAKLQNWWISLHCGPSDPSEMDLLNVNLKSPSGPYIHNSKQWIWWFCVK